MRRARAEIATIASNPVQPLSHTAAVAGWGAVPADFEDSSAYRSVFQDWEMWMRLGWLDGACPMIYLREHVVAESDRYRGWVEAAMGWRYQRHMYIGQCLYNNSMTNSITQMQYAYDEGADGTINFAYGATADNDLNGTWEADWSWYPLVAESLFLQAGSDALRWTGTATALPREHSGGRLLTDTAENRSTARPLRLVGSYPCRPTATDTTSLH